MATGHGGLTTLHGENIEYSIRRLISPPMNVSETYIPLINLVAFIERVTLPGTLKVGRRMRMAWEIEDFNKYINIYSWSPQDDVFLSNVRDSIVLRKIAEKLGKSRTWIYSEMERRKSVLHWMLEKGIRNVNDVARIVYQYYSNPEELMSKIGEEPVKTEELEAVLATPTIAAPSYQVSEPEAPARFLEEPLLKVYEILNAHGGTASIQMLVNESGIDEVTLWRFLNILKSFRHVSVVEKKEGEKFSTFFVLSDRASGAYETLKARLQK